MYKAQLTSVTTLHIEQLYCKLIKFTSLFYKLRSKLAELSLKQLYFACVHSILFTMIKYINIMLELKKTCILITVALRLVSVL